MDPIELLKSLDELSTLKVDPDTIPASFLQKEAPPIDTYVAVKEPGSEPKNADVSNAAPEERSFKPYMFSLADKVMADPGQRQPMSNVDSPIVREYISRLSGGRQSDPEFQAAMDETNRRRTANAIIGPNAPNGLYGLLSTYNGLAGIAAPPKEAFMSGVNLQDPDEPLKDLMAKRKLESDMSERGLKDLNQLAQIKQREALAEKYGLNLNNAKDAEKLRLMIAAQSELNREKALDAAVQHRKEMLPISKESADAKRLMAETGNERFRHVVGKEGEERGQTVAGVSGDMSNVTPKERQTLSDMVSAYQQAQHLVGKISNLKDSLLNYATIPGTTRDVELNQARALLVPLITQATAMGRLTKPHQDLASVVVGDPEPGAIDRLRGLNANAVEAMYSGLLDDLKDAVNIKLNNVPGGVGLHMTEPGKKDEQIVRKYSTEEGKYKAEEQEKPSRTEVLMKDKDGKIWHVKLKDIPAAKKIGGVLLDDSGNEINE